MGKHLKKAKQYHAKRIIRAVYSMRPVKNYAHVKNTLGYLERNEGIDNPITVGILIADYRRSFCRENILDQLERLDKKSGSLIDFYIPGYIRCTRYAKHSNSQLVYKTARYRFSLREFNGFLEELEHKGIKVTGRTQFLLVPYERGQLWFKDALVFDLEKDEASGKIESTKLFFDFIFDISKRTTDFNEFQKRIKLGRAKTTFIDFVKDQLPSSLWSLVTTPFSKLFKLGK